MINTKPDWQPVGDSRYRLKRGHDSLEVRAAWTMGRWLACGYLVLAATLVAQTGTPILILLIPAGISSLLFVDIFVRNRVSFRPTGVRVGMRWIPINNIATLEVTEQAVDAQWPAAAPVLRVRIKNGRVRALLCDPIDIDRSMLLAIKEQAERVLRPESVGND